ncbi:Protein nud1 [Thecaphora frezii]
MRCAATGPDPSTLSQASRSPSSSQLPSLDANMTEERDLSSSGPSWRVEGSEPRTSTPQGPHPMSPPKRPPSPIPANTSATSVIDYGEADATVELEHDAAPSAQRAASEEPAPVDEGGTNRQPDATTNDLQALDFGIGLDQANHPPQPDRPDGPEEPSATDMPPSPQPQLHVTQPDAPQQAQSEEAQGQSDADAQAKPSIPDWMTDELDESWREASHSDSAPFAAFEMLESTKMAATTQTATAEAAVVDGAATHLALLQDQPTATVPSLGSVRLPLSGLGSRSVSTAVGFFDARESLGVNGPRSSQAPSMEGRRKPRPSMLGRSLTDTELQPGPSTPSKRKPSHAIDTAAAAAGTTADDGQEGDQDDRAGSRSPVSAPEDFESARGSIIERSVMADPRHGVASPRPDRNASDDAVGTFIHRADVSSLPPMLRPKWQNQDRGGNPHSPKRKGGVMAAIGGDMFTPMKLQTMFRTPTPPDRATVSLSVATASLEREAGQDPERGAAGAQEDGDVKKTPRVSHRDFADSPSAAKAATRTASALPQLKMPSGVFTFRTPQASSLQAMHPTLETLSAARQASSYRDGLQARPASAAASFGLASAIPPTVATHMISAPSTPRTPMRLFKFNYEDAATRARLEMLVNRNGAAATNGGEVGAGEAERERKRLRLDVKPRRVISGDLVSMRASALIAVAVEPSKAVEDTALDARPASPSGKPSDRDVLGEISVAGEAPGHRASVAAAGAPPSTSSNTQQLLPSANDVIAASPSKSTLLPPVVDYVKEAPVFMSALQRQMVRSGSDTTASSKAWVTEDENAGDDGDDDGNQDRRQWQDHGTRQGLDTVGEQVSFHQGSFRASPSKTVAPPQSTAKSPQSRWKQRRTAARTTDDADKTEEHAPVQRSPSGSPRRLSERRLPQTSSFHYDSTPRDTSAYEWSQPLMSSTLKSRKSWVSRVGPAVREDESPRKLLRRYSAAALAEEEALSQSEQTLLEQYRCRALRNGQSGDASEHQPWSDESFKRDQKIRELEAKLAHRSAARGCTSGSWSCEEVDDVVAERSDARPTSRPHLITLHEPTMEGARAAEVRRNGAILHNGYDEHSDTWDDEDAESNGASGPRRIQDGIVLCDSEKVYPAGYPGQPTRSLRSVVSEAQLRPRAVFEFDADTGDITGRRTTSGTGRERSSQRPKPMPEKDGLFQGPRHPSTVCASQARPSSSRYLSSGNGDEDGRRGERTASSNTLVEDRNPFSYDSRLSANYVGSISNTRTAIELGVDRSGAVNGLGATITRRGSMLNISQIPDEEVAQLGGENFLYDRERNRWVKKKPSSESLKTKAALDPHAVATNPHEDPAKGRGSAFGRRSTTRTPAEPTIHEASVETSRAELSRRPWQTPQDASMRRSSKYGTFGRGFHGLPAAEAEAAIDTSNGQDGRLSDSSDPFKDFESFGQSSAAADHSSAEAQNMVGVEAAGQGPDLQIEDHGGGIVQPQLEGPRSSMATAASQPALRTQPGLTRLQPRTVSGPPAYISGFRPISTMPRARSALRNVINYSPDVTMRSDASGATGATVTATVEAQPSQSGQNRTTQEHTTDAVLRQRQVQERNAYVEPHQSQHGAQAPPSPLLPTVRSNRIADADEPHMHPTTPERRYAAATDHAYLTPPLANRSRLETPPRSILKPSPSGHAAAGRRRSASNSLHPASPNPVSANKTISFADMQTTHRYAGNGRTTYAHDGRDGTAVDGSELSESLDADWTEEDEEDEDEETAKQYAYSRERHATPRRSSSRAVDSDRASAISMALQQLAELTLQPEVEQQEFAPPPTHAASPSTRRVTSRLSASEAPGRSPWSYAALRRPRRVRDPYAEDGDHGDDTYDELHGYPDMTLLTDASFNVAHDRILEVITDVEPWEPGWDQLKTIDLSERRVESCLRLKEFLPSLEEIKLDRNEVAYLTGLPPSLRSLSISHNRITQLASFGQLLNLESLDISHNRVETLWHLQCLKHLHTLVADHAHISSLDGIDRLRSLVRVKLSGNLLKGVHLEQTEWQDLESLDLSHNALITVRGLGSLRRLRWLNLDHNRLSRVDLEPSLPKLRTLRVSGNTSLKGLDVAPAKKLRKLYADYCALDSIQSLESLTRLDSLSMRQQVDARVVWPARHLRDARRLYFSGNAFPQGLDFKALPSSGPPELHLRQPVPMVRFLNLVYLELAACQLTALPVELPELAPNLRSLNLDHNLISSLPPLLGMQRLKRLSVVGCRLKNSKAIIRAIRGLGELRVVDTRTNPCTLGLYPPLMIPAAGNGLDGRRSASPSSGLVTAASHLPPVPNPAVVQPDRAQRLRKQAERQRQAEVLAADKSHFHKRHPPHSDPALYDEDDDDDEGGDFSMAASNRSRGAERGGVKGKRGGGGGGDMEHAYAAPNVTALFLAADERFYDTLPKGFRAKRLLHRGLMAMSCPNLTWIDGLFVEEQEVMEANELIQSQQTGGDDKP